LTERCVQYDNEVSFDLPVRLLFAVEAIPRTLGIITSGVTFAVRIIGGTITLIHLIAVETRSSFWESTVHSIEETFFGITLFVALIVTESRVTKSSIRTVLPRIVSERVHFGLAIESREWRLT
jgi:hypothetical protein